VIGGGRTKGDRKMKPTESFVTEVKALFGVDLEALFKSIKEDVTCDISFYKKPFSLDIRRDKRGNLRADLVER